MESPTFRFLLHPITSSRSSYYSNSDITRSVDNDVAPNELKRRAKNYQTHSSPQSRCEVPKPGPYQFQHPKLPSTREGWRLQVTNRPSHENRQPLPRFSSESGIDECTQEESSTNFSSFASRHPSRQQHITTNTHYFSSNSRSEPESYILVCLKVGQVWQLRQFSYLDKQSASHSDFFKQLREEYRKTRYIVHWPRLFPDFFVKVKIKYVRFQIQPRSFSPLPIKYHDFPPESEKENYAPCRPALSVDPPVPEAFLEHYYRNDCELAQDEWILNSIPKKLHHKLYPNGEKEIIGWGLELEERPNTRALTVLLILIGLPMLYLTGSLWTLFLLIDIGLSLRSLYRLRISYVDQFSLPRKPGVLLKNPLTRSQASRVGCSTPVLIHASTTSESTDLEAQEDGKRSQKEKNAGTSSQLRTIVSWIAWWNKRGADDDGTKNLKLEKQGDDEHPDVVIPICMNNNSNCLPFLVQLSKKQYLTDSAFFEELRGKQSKHGYSDWAGFLRLCGLRRVIGIHYVKFELFPDGRVQILGKPKYPSRTTSSRYRPAEEDFSTANETAETSLRPLDSRTLLYFYRNPSECTSSTFVLERITRKLDGPIRCVGGPRVGYGMELEEGPDQFRLDIVCVILIFLCNFFGLGWAVKSGDIQSGFAISASLTIIVAALIRLSKGLRLWDRSIL